MNPTEAAAASAAAVSGLASHFMLDPTTYARAADAGFAGMDFYVAGRGGALGDVAGATVAAAFVFFNPEAVISGWERGLAVSTPAASCEAWATAAHDWAEANLPDGPDYARLAELAGAVVGGADGAGAPLFAAWRLVSEPGTDRPKALALHRMNGLRELRMALHGAAVLGHGLTPLEALSVRTPYMAPIFGWAGPAEDVERLRPVWDAAEAATNVAFGRALAILTAAERTEFADLAAAAQSAVS